MQFNVRMFLHSLGNTSRHFRAVERPLSGRGSVDQSEATEHWCFPGLFRVMRFISSRNTNGPENQVEKLVTFNPLMLRAPITVLLVTLVHHLVKRT